MHSRRIRARRTRHNCIRCSRAKQPNRQLAPETASEEVSSTAIALTLDLPAGFQWQSERRWGVVRAVNRGQLQQPKRVKRPMELPPLTEMSVPEVGLSPPCPVTAQQALRVHRTSTVSGAVTTPPTKYDAVIFKDN